MKYTIPALYVLVVLTTCSKEEVTSRAYPRVLTQPVSAITSAGAEFHGEITYASIKITDYGFIWSSSKSPSFENSDTLSLGEKIGTGSFSSPVNRGLLQGIKYYARAYARSGNYLVYGEVVSFVSMGSESPYTIVNFIPSRHLMPRDVVTVLGNFPDVFQVKVGGKLLPAAILTNVTNGQFKFHIPDSTKHGASVSIVVAGQEITTTRVLSMTLSFRNKGTAVVKRAYNSTNCVIGDKDYFGFGYFSPDAHTNLLTNSMFTYDPATDVFAASNPPIMSARYSPISFSINGIGYFGGGKAATGGLTDFHSLNPVTHEISKLDDIPMPDGTEDGFNSNSTVTAFAIGNKGYCLVFTQIPSTKNELYEFDPVTGHWSKKADYPGRTKTAGAFQPVPYCFVQNNIAYVGGGESYGSELWSYEPQSNNWTRLNLDVSITSFDDDNNCVMDSNGKVYLINSDYESSTGVRTTRFYEFLPERQTFKASHSTPIRFNLNGGFGMGTTGYFYSATGVWEFDTNR